MQRESMTMVSGAAKAVPGAFFVERKRLVAAEEGILSRQRVEKATQRRAVVSGVRRKEVTVLQKFVKSGFATFIYKSAVLSLELVSDL